MLLVHTFGAISCISRKGRVSMSRSLASSVFCFSLHSVFAFVVCLWLFRVVVLRRVSIRTFE
jgi:hypothetical protein